MKYAKYKKMLSKKRFNDVIASITIAEYSRAKFYAGKRGKHFKGREKLFGTKRRQMPIRSKNPVIAGGENAQP